MSNLPESLVTELRMGKKKCFFTCFYRSPSQKSFDKFDTFYFNLNLFLSNINDLNRASSVLIDDFNAGTSIWWSSIKNFWKSCNTLLNNFGWVQPPGASAYSCNWQFLLLLWLGFCIYSTAPWMKGDIKSRLIWYSNIKSKSNE